MNSITNFQTYMPFALRTAKHFPDKQQRLHAMIGMVTEMGEIGDNLKRLAIYGTEFKPVNLMEEIGDFFWYLSLYLHVAGQNGKAVDAWVEGFKPTKNLDPAAAPFVMLDAVIALSGLVPVLHMPEDERGVPEAPIIDALLTGLALLLGTTGFTFEQCLNRNIEKLAARYGDKYSDFRALNRDLPAEAVILEGAAPSV